MANDYKTPGVYVEEITKFPPSVAQVETAIPAFIGYTEIARLDGEDLVGRPTRISSLLEYEDYFGFAESEKNVVVNVELTTDGTKTTKENWTASIEDGKGSKHLMYYALQSYFDNGGGPCYIISVGKGYADDFAAPLLSVDLIKGLEALQDEDEPTLIIFPESQGMDEDEHYSLLSKALRQCAALKDRFVIMDLHTPQRNLTVSDKKKAIDNFRNGVSGVVKYGAAYFPNIRTVFDYRVDAEDLDAVKIIFTTNGGAPVPKIYKDLNNAEKSKAGLAIRGMSINLPPSAAVAGVYARVDEARGVWKAPANENINSLDGLSFKLSDELQKDLNVDVIDGKSINCIRFFIGKGYKVWGARTLAGNDNEWRYVPVRRFFNMVEESVKKATYQFVFEPNDAGTWVRVGAMIENFLLSQWRAGALQGVKPEHAFYVSVGLGKTMTAMDILEGRMIIEIGMAAVRPAEFIILRFSHKMAES